MLRPLLLPCLAVFLLASHGEASSSALLKKPKTAAEAARQAAALLKAMTPEERFDLVCGTGYGMRAIPRLGIPQINFLDSTAGVRLFDNTGRPLLQDPDPNEKSTSFPAPIVLSATWDTQLAGEYAHAIGEECRALDVHFLLGPGLNIYRLSENGRNFEYFGEDPYLTARMAEAYVRGLQSTGVAATIKHFLCNNNELRRRAANSIVDERALHEIYLPAFQAGVKAGTWAVMTSYNQVNGQWSGQSHDIITGLLRDQLGFQNLCMTDWSSVWDGEKVANSGQDLEMPNGAALRSAKDKLLGSPAIDQMALGVLKTGIASGLYELASTGKFHQPELLARYPAHAAIARRVNEEGIVLLKNNGLLPITNAPAHILVCGNDCQRKDLAAGGAAYVIGYDSQSYADAAVAAFPHSTVIVASTPTDDQIRSADLVLLFTGFTLAINTKDYEGEGYDRPFHLPEDALVARCAQLNPKTVVSLVAGGGVSMDWCDHVAAILQASYGGQTGAAALFAILTGQVNPSAKLPFTIEKKFEDSPAFGYDQITPNPETYHSPLMNEDDYGFFFDAARHDFRTYNVNYREGVFVGYRWYAAHRITPRFPFGHGLSYTTFAFDNLKAKTVGPTVHLTFTLKNTGSRSGAEVPQIYVGAEKSSVPRPPWELKGFRKITLAPDETQTVSIILDRNAFEFWDSATHAWKLEPGKFRVAVGASSVDLRLTTEIQLN